MWCRWVVGWGSGLLMVGVVVGGFLVGVEDFLLTWWVTYGMMGVSVGEVPHR